MNLLAGIMHGQAVTLVLLSVFLVLFIVLDVYLVLFLHRRNKKLAKNTDLTSDSESENDGTSTTTNEKQTDSTEKL